MRCIYDYTPATNHIAWVYSVMIYLLTAVGFPSDGSDRYNCTQLDARGETIQEHGTHKLASSTHKTSKKTKRKIKKQKTIN